MDRWPPDSGAPPCPIARPPRRAPIAHVRAGEGGGSKEAGLLPRKVAHWPRVGSFDSAMHGEQIEGQAGSAGRTARLLSSSVGGREGAHGMAQYEKRHSGAQTLARAAKTCREMRRTFPHRNSPSHSPSRAGEPRAARNNRDLALPATSHFFSRWPGRLGRRAGTGREEIATGDAKKEEGRRTQISARRALPRAWQISNKWSNLYAPEHTKYAPEHVWEVYG
jgi:hypothetical protein